MKRSDIVIGGLYCDGFGTRKVTAMAVFHNDRRMHEVHYVCMSGAGKKKKGP